jgi:hypothetical protein
MFQAGKNAWIDDYTGCFQPERMRGLMTIQDVSSRKNAWIDDYTGCFNPACHTSGGNTE